MTIDRPAAPRTPPQGASEEPPFGYEQCGWSVVGYFAPFVTSDRAEAAATALSWVATMPSEPATVVPLYRKVDTGVAAAIASLPDVAPTAPAGDLDVLKAAVATLTTTAYTPAAMRRSAMDAIVNASPALLAEIERLRAENAALTATTERRASMLLEAANLMDEMRDSRRLAMLTVEMGEALLAEARAEIADLRAALAATEGKHTP